MNRRDIELLLLKDEKTFEKFYYKYHKLIFKIIYDKVYDFQVAEDLVQDTFIKVIEDLDSYRGANFKYWVITIGKNIANMYLRKEIRDKERLDEYANEQLITKNEMYLEVEEIDIDLFKEIKEIVDDETYEIIIMHLVRGYKFREIAEAKNQTTGVILGKYHRGIKKIRSEIDYEKL